MSIERVIINFAGKCNMSCPYCYIPFDGMAYKWNSFKKTLYRCRELGVKVITFGGGDPFQFRYFRDALQLCKELALEVHVDTNGLCLSKEDYPLLYSTTSLLGLPLDGSNCTVHMNMRGSATHYRKIIQHLNDLRGFGVRVKVNTVASRMNLDDLKNMPDLLSQFHIQIWSLYQYMPLAGGVRVKDQFSITEDEFESVADELRSISVPFKFEPSTISLRNHSYFFVSPSGVAYTHDPFDSHRYLFIGDINDTNCIHTFLKINKATMRDEARYRYYSFSERQL